MTQDGSAGKPVDAQAQRREIVAGMCKLIGKSIQGERPPKTLAREVAPTLSPRMRQTLDRLLGGDSEKQIAQHLGLSKHTVHVYVKAIYKGFGVSSRGELLAQFIHPPK
ncbi:MAG TPA: helix-turn-helix transcriptional regulator [Tepidisphaeraceae bacterium]|nr:helix-turn-helix transcriptional regulator [Tepidisphaeraceae bacterium]